MCPVICEYLNITVIFYVKDLQKKIIAIWLDLITKGSLQKIYVIRSLFEVSAVKKKKRVYLRNLRNT